MSSPAQLLARPFQPGDYFTVTHTNIQGLTDLRDMIARAKVILIAERYLHNSDTQSQANLINSIQSSNIRILFEGNSIQRLSEIITKPIETHSWDRIDHLQEYRQFIGATLCPLLWQGISLLSVGSSVFNNQSPPVDDIKLLLSLNPSIEIIDRIAQLTLDTFKSSSAIWIQNLQQALGEEDRIATASIFDRNINLVETIRQSIIENYDQIIVIAGAAHVANIGSLKYADDLHEQLNALSVPYITLQPTDFNPSSHIDNITALTTLQQSMQSTSEVSMSMIDHTTMVQKLKEKHFSYTPLNTNEFVHDAMQLALPILCLQKVVL